MRTSCVCASIALLVLATASDATPASAGAACPLGQHVLAWHGHAPECGPNNHRQQMAQPPAAPQQGQGPKGGGPRLAGKNLAQPPAVPQLGQRPKSPPPGGRKPLTPPPS